MANIMENRVDAILKPDEMAKIFDLIKEIQKLLPNAENLTLTDADRAGLSSLNVDNKAFVEDTINEVRSNGANIMPAAIQANHIQNDLTLFEQMDQVLSWLANVNQIASDVCRIAANEAYKVSNAAYNIFAISAQSGIKGAQASYDKLKLRYKNQGGGGKPIENP